MLIILIEDLDTLLLLTVQSACNLTGVKVPWEKVAQLMGPKFTEGAIVQHLSKLRIRREAAGQRVPPPLRRSVTAAAAAAGGGKGSKAGRQNARRRKGRSGAMEDDFSDDLDAPGEDDSDPEYFQGKKKRKSGRYSLPTSKKSKMTMEDDDEDDEDALMCGGAPFLQHLQPELDTDHADSDSDDSDEDFDDEFDSDSYNAKIKAEQASPTPRPSRVVKLPVSLQTQDQKPMKSIRSIADATPPPSTTMAGNRNQTFIPNDPAVMGNNPVPSYGNQGAYYPSQMVTGQVTGNPVQAGQNPFYWPLPTPVVGGRILAPGEFTWSPHTPGYATGRGGALQVSGPPPPSWDPAPTTAGEAPAQAMDHSALDPDNLDPNSWFMDETLFVQDDDEAKGSHDQHLGKQEY